MLRLHRKSDRPSPVTLGDRALAAGQWEAATHHYRAALARNPDRAPIWVQYGHALKESGNLLGAEAAYRRAIEQDPSAADSRLQFGHVLKLQGKIEEAKAAYGRAFALDHSLWDAAVELEALGCQINELAQAREHGASDSAPGNQAAAAGRKRRRVSVITRADRARDLGDWERAISLYWRALSRNPRNAPIWTQYGHVLKASGQLGEAEQAYRHALSHAPLLLEPSVHLGLALKLQGKTKEAQATFLRAFAVDPSTTSLRDELHALGWSTAETAELATTLGQNEQADGAAALSHDPVETALSDCDAADGHLAETQQACSLRLDPEWYLKRYPDVAQMGMDPFEHFLQHGLKEGRVPNAAEVRHSRIEGERGIVAETAGPWSPVTAAKIHCIKPPECQGEIALFVTHSPYGCLKPHVLHYLSSLKAQGIAVVLIVAADRPFVEPEPNLSTMIDGLFVRQNEGYDFAAWAHVLLLYPSLFDAQILYLLNDSVIGPTNALAFGDMLAALREDSADLIGLTENLERNWHIQSYFLAIKSRTLSSVVFQKFIHGIKSFKYKEDVINQYEIRLAPTLVENGFTCKALFRDFRTPTIYHWSYLLDCGFPFIKTSTIAGAFPGVEISNWRDALAARNFDVSLAERTLAEAGNPMACGENAALTELLAMGDRAELIHGETKVGFIGPWNYDNGLGVASRGFISALRHTRLSLNFYPIRRALHIHRRIAPAVDICDFGGAPDAVIIHYNPDGWSDLLTEGQRATMKQAKLIVGHWVWEMPQVPEYWFPGFDTVDAIWAPSRYCADVFAKRAKVPIDVIPYVISATPSVLDEGRVVSLRRDLGLSEEDRVILYAFDGSSYLVRKNPFALVRSFARSHLAERGWRLVLKTKHLFDRPEEGKRLQEDVDRTAGVVLIDRSFDKAVMDALMWLADIYASPHCAEGFGLTVAEAMALGKIVVATDYSGSRDFVDVSCGFPVAYRLRELEDDHGHYTRDGGAWAEIDEDHLTDSLIAASALIDSGDRRLGNAARRRIEDLLSPAAVAVKMQDSISRLLNTGCKP